MRVILHPWCSVINDDDYAFFYTNQQLLFVLFSVCFGSWTFGRTTTRGGRRLVSNPLGSAHPEATLKAALEHGAPDDAIQARHRLFEFAATP